MLFVQSSIIGHFYYDDDATVINDDSLLFFDCFDFGEGGHLPIIINFMNV